MGWTLEFWVVVSGYSVFEFLELKGGGGRPFHEDSAIALIKWQREKLKTSRPGGRGWVGLPVKTALEGGGR